jgi:hypothetical protein
MVPPGNDRKKSGLSKEPEMTFKASPSIPKMDLKIKRKKTPFSLQPGGFLEF